MAIIYEKSSPSLHPSNLTDLRKSGFIKSTVQNYFQNNYLTFYSKFLSRVKKIRGQEYQAICPFHADSKPSLSFNNETGLYFCHGCNEKGDAFSFYAKVHGLHDKDDFVKILDGICSDFGIAQEKEEKRLVKTYDYEDAQGKVLFQVCRYEPKGFKQRRPDGNGGWIWNLQGIETVLYRLPKVLESQEILIVEGEKDADNLGLLGFTATTCPMGAGKWREHFNEVLKNKDLILCPDNDDPGREHMKQVALSLTEKVRSLKWLELPGLPQKGDVSDFIASFKDPQDANERLCIMIENAPPFGSSEDKRSSYDSLNLPSSLNISQLEIRVEWLVENLIPKESLTLFHSIGGVGKSYLMYALAKAVADGTPFFGLPATQSNVYYIDFENPLPEIVDRLKKIGGSPNVKIWHLRHDPMPVRFDDDEQWPIYKTFPPGLFIIDSLRSSHLLEENSSRDASFILARLKEIRSLGSTIIQIHHENKGGSYRGSTAWFDLSDHILKFSRVRKVGSDEDVEEDDFDLPLKLAVKGKSRFSSAMELKPMYFKFKDHRLCLAKDSEEEILNKMATLLNPSNPPNQSEFRKLAKDNLNIQRKVFDKLLKKGEARKVWFSRRSQNNNKLEYLRVENEAS